MTESIMRLKDIRDELQKEVKLYTANSLEKAMYLCDIAEHISLAIHHLNFAINKLIAYKCFNGQESDTK